MTKNQVWEMLYGSWKSDDGKITFQIKDEMIYWDQKPYAGHIIVISYYEPFDKWMINVPMFFWAHTYITKLNENLLEVTDYDNGNPAESIIIDPVTKKPLNGGKVFKFIKL